MLKKYQLFIFPFAGGSVSYYSKWEKKFDSNIQVIPVEFPGRGYRIKEELIGDMNSLLDDLYSKVLEDRDHNCPFGFYGHSLGAVTAFELFFRLQQTGHATPIHMFLSGRLAPHLADNLVENIHLYENEPFKREVMSFGGTPSPTLLDLFLPILRNDVKVIETFRTPKREAINCKPVIFMGKEDATMKGNYAEWNEYFLQPCKIHEFNGGHFFINDSYENIVRIIQSEIA
jgi:surfactin synthase thioesterase subunit